MEALTNKQKLIFERNWKSGEIILHKIIMKDKDKVFKNWKRIGLIKKISQFEYRIDRSVYLKLEQEDQEKLFGEAKILIKSERRKK